MLICCCGYKLSIGCLNTHYIYIYIYIYILACRHPSICCCIDISSHREVCRNTPNLSILCWKANAGKSCPLFSHWIQGERVFSAHLTLLSLCCLVRLYYTADTRVRYVALWSECTVVIDTICV